MGGTGTWCSHQDPEYVLTPSSQAGKPAGNLMQMLELANQDSETVFNMYIPYVQKVKQRHGGFKKKTQVKLLDMFDSSVFEIKNTLHGTDGGLDTAEEKTG